MADDVTPKLEVLKPEAQPADLEAIAQEIKRVKDLPENAAKTAHELIRTSLQAMAAATPPPPPAAQTPGFLPSYSQTAATTVKKELEELIGVALSQGVAEAIKQAKHSNPFVLDALHDALVGRLYPELKKRGIIE